MTWTAYTCRDPPEIPFGSILILSSPNLSSYPNDSRQPFMHPHSVIRYICDPGYYLVNRNSAINTDTRLCTEDGNWNEPSPACLRMWLFYTFSQMPFLTFASWSFVTPAVDCGKPDLQVEGGKMYLPNKTTTFMSIARLKCNFRWKLLGDSDIRCTEEATWTELLATCEREQHNDVIHREEVYSTPSSVKSSPSGFTDGKTSVRNIESKVGNVLACVIFGVLVCILIMLGFLFKKRILKISFKGYQKSFRRRRRHDAGHQSNRESSSNEDKLDNDKNQAKAEQRDDESEGAQGVKTVIVKDTQVYSSIRCSGSYERTERIEKTEVSLKDHVKSTVVDIEVPRKRKEAEGKDLAKDCLSVEEETEKSRAEKERQDQNETDAILALYAKIDLVQKKKKQSIEASNRSNYNVQDAPPSRIPAAVTRTIEAQIEKVPSSVRNDPIKSDHESIVTKLGIQRRRNMMPDSLSGKYTPYPVLSSSPISSISAASVTKSTSPTSSLSSSSSSYSKTRRPPVLI